MKRLAIYVLLALAGVSLRAQGSGQTVTGTVLDKNGSPLAGVSIRVKGVAYGTMSDATGEYRIAAQANDVLLFTYLGMAELEKAVAGQSRVDVTMSEGEQELEDVIITSSIAVDRKTPVAVSSITIDEIENKLGTQEFPEILKSTPSVYATKDGGAWGDGQVNLRGFKSENIAVMVNGVPMNDMEWGGVYWSNWAGLSDVTRIMQVQRGMGASKVAAPSVGGSINIVTKSIDAKRGGGVSYGVGNDGYNKVLFNVSTGLTESGWALTLLGGKTWGDGYIQGTEFEGYNYFVNIAKRLGSRHQLSLTALGAPQVHNQRSSYDGLTIAGWQAVKKFMPPGKQYLYNPTYGFGKNGERLTSATNKYHKPQISLNHLWQVSDKSSLSTALYLSIGDGWGTSGQGTSAYSSAWYGASNGTLNTTFRNADGTFAYDQIQDLNENSLNGSQMVMSTSINNHKWYGLLSTYTHELSNNLNFYVGIDGRYYVATHTNEITDLYNGDYYVDRYRANVSAANNAAAADPNWGNQKLSVGDVVYRDYDGHVAQGGAFGQLEYAQGDLSAFVAASLSGTSQWRYDRFYYDAEHAESDKVNAIGFTAKGGANYNLGDYHNVFANIGYISRAPYFSGGAFLSSTVNNATNPNAVNEKIFSFELGYGFHTRWLNAKVNLYRTQWNDKTMARSIDITFNGNPDRSMINMEGVNATHQGVELELVASPYTWLDLNGMLSIGDWRWTNNPIGYFYNSSGQPLTKTYTVASGIQAPDHAKMTLLTEDVIVGGSAQTTAALGATLKLGKSIRIGIDWNLYDRNYADWAFSTSDLVMDSQKEFSTSWLIPAGNTFDLNASYRFSIGGFNAVLSGNINNLFDQEYISNAYDGASHDWQTAYRVFYGFGRQLSLRLKINF
ncbi:MAG: TonB-dependent receptor [Prevotellaceae bacterium]|jgi:outer membrane cobalamin receptor|nr:TonB-dependent receptor [Prevotellaceae bacterium]